MGTHRRLRDHRAPKPDHTWIWLIACTLITALVVWLLFEILDEIPNLTKPTP